MDQGLGSQSFLKVKRTLNLRSKTSYINESLQKQYSFDFSLLLELHEHCQNNHMEIRFKQKFYICEPLTMVHTFCQELYLLISLNKIRKCFDEILTRTLFSTD